MFAAELVDRARALITLLRDRRIKIATAESCTGGLVAALLTEIPGSSAVVERGFVVYSNEAKEDLLGVAATTLRAHGAVSAETARAMAEGALAHSRADIAVSITGVAGPEGGTPQKPVGLVHFGFAGRDGRIEAVEKRYGDIGRTAVRLAAVRTALELLEQAAGLN
ncbi:MAG TPA: CinA family protein [Roseiarcus sp.]|nr:CinA family protein [Roseiarcus sp.]